MRVYKLTTMTPQVPTSLSLAVSSLPAREMNCIFVDIYIYFWMTNAAKKHRSLVSGHELSRVKRVCRSLYKKNTFSRASEGFVTFGLSSPSIVVLIKYLGVLLMLFQIYCFINYLTVGRLWESNVNNLTS